ncbi:MAG: deoxyhypusine synthase [Desulfurococcales archaeon]|nr:deoxyhypusine synthase [Desulfurococcales archaeon]
MKLSDLISAFKDMHGFTAQHVAQAVDILREGLKKADLRFLSFTANVVATGLRGVLTQLVESGLFDVVVTTCGTLDHDIARATGGKYLKGFFEADDAYLKSKGYHRLGNVFIPFDSYGLTVEEFVKKLVESAVSQKREWGIRELLQLAGELLSENRDSILGAAYRKGVRVYVPGFVDGAFGTNLFIQSQFTGLKINLFKDMKELSDLVFNSEVSAALILGGGISKHHTIWWNQFKDGLDYAVYITTAVEWDGSLSGAKTREAITWGKLKPSGKHVTVYGDVTVLLPIIAAGIL